MAWMFVQKVLKGDQMVDCLATTLDAVVTTVDTTPGEAATTVDTTPDAAVFGQG